MTDDLPYSLLITAETQGSEGYQYFQHTGHCYKLMGAVTSLKVANEHCAKENAALVSIHDRETNTFVAHLSKSHQLIGLFYQTSEYVWSDGTAFNFSNWHLGYPVPQTYFGSCVETQPDGLWFNIVCDHSNLPFVCEKRPEETTTTITTTTTLSTTPAQGVTCPDPHHNYLNSGTISSPGFPFFFGGKKFSCRYQLLVPVGSRVLITFDALLLGSSDSIRIFEGIRNASLLSTIGSDLTGHRVTVATNTKNMMTVLYNSGSEGMSMWAAKWGPAPESSTRAMPSPKPITTLLSKPTTQSTTSKPSTTTETMPSSGPITIPLITPTTQSTTSKLSTITETMPPSDPIATPLITPTTQSTTSKLSTITETMPSSDPITTPLITRTTNSTTTNLSTADPTAPSFKPIATPLTTPNTNSTITDLSTTNETMPSSGSITTPLTTPNTNSTIINLSTTTETMPSSEPITTPLATPTTTPNTSVPVTTPAMFQCPSSIIESPSGFLSSPGYPNGYPINLACWYTIKTKSDKRIWVEFLDVDTLHCCDLILVYNDGLTNQEPTTILSGKVGPTSVVSTRNELAILFTSSALHSRNLAGWRARFKEIPGFKQRLRVAISNANECSSGWYQNSQLSNKCHKVYEQRKRFDEAMSHCQQNDAKVSRSENALDNFYAAELMRNGEDTRKLFWLGLSYVEDKWKWADGRILKYNNWANGES
ncbi:unnamed protein product [Anisakis simplex]|uniref:C-type lectin domain-containing protein n=1 Tax=Anisakis simplex TaxID=6269 RepID=A0A0M3JW65_ANISI|nr:unnamed protein product [Anisakis simplex]